MPMDDDDAITCEHCGHAPTSDEVEDTSNGESYECPECGELSDLFH